MEFKRKPFDTSRLHEVSDEDYNDGKSDENLFLSTKFKE